jgi:predicted PurR-regulated permease PerM
MARIAAGSDDLALFTRKVTIVVAFVLMLVLLWEAREVVVLVLIAAALATGIAPVVRRVRAGWRFLFHRRLSRGAAVAMVYLPFLVLVLLIGILIVPRLIVEGRELGAKMPVLIERNVLQPLEPYIPAELIREEMREGIELPRSRVFFYVRSVAAGVASVLAVLFLVAYMLIDAERLRNMFLLVYSPSERGEKRRTLMRIAKRLSGWLSAQLLLSAIIGVCSFAGYMLLGIPYALPLAIIAAVGELIPMIGPTIGAVPALAIALLHSPWQFWAVLVFAVLLQKAENLFIVPRVMAGKVSISPLAVFVAFMIGASILGVVGAIMAIPCAAVAQVAFEEAFVARRERRQDAERAGTLLRKAD